MVNCYEKRLQGWGRQAQNDASSSSKEFTSGLWRSKVKIQSPTGYKLKSIQKGIFGTYLVSSLPQL